jgi:hypothetical protein
MSEQPTAPVAGVQELVDRHALFARCISTALRRHRGGQRAAILAADGVEALPADTDRHALVVMSLTTARFVAYVTESGVRPGEDPELLWRRFSVGEEAMIRVSYRPGRDALPADIAREVHP